MTILDYYECGVVKEFFEKGLISINVYTYFRYYDVWKAYKKKGLSNNKSYQFAADECGCTEQTIRNAVNLVTR